ncbi:DUF871 domain-containing protein [Streptococcus moroccensis]|uniref:Outer surface protein n=1 Tax=Streptococcus moroccensis TaxID=1451356 RepID=A0ABT9YQ76_9STRE|nr:MupG family TIM beta-alpha barrel fold protein [Streptococcus moroccensis]MDQ0222143.1 hypothetical protein [Streptococcus moroccensis]
MAKLGFSLYPEHHDLETLKSYVDQFSETLCERVFLSMLQLDPDDLTMFDHYKFIVTYCQSKSFKVFADLSPEFIKKIGWQDDLIKRAFEFGLSGIRLDESYPDQELVDLSHNSYGVKIELNMSTEPKLLERLVTLGVNLDNITACHNFYPREYTGLGTDYFLKISEEYSRYGIERAAFITAQTADTGPWPVSEGLCTLEDHRHLPLEYQYKWMQASGVVDHIIIANQLVSKNELKMLPKDDVLDLTINIHPNISEIEKSIILNEAHCYRGDVSDYVIRSTNHRPKYSQCDISPLPSNREVTRGDILIDNSLYGRYCGELQIALRDFKISEKTNLVGRISQEDLSLIDLLKPWQSFRFSPRES